MCRWVNVNFNSSEVSSWELIGMRNDQTLLLYNSGRNAGTYLLDSTNGETIFQIRDMRVQVIMPDNRMVALLGLFMN